MSGTVSDLRPPNRNAAIGTPSWDSHASRSKTGHCTAGAVNRPFGCAAVRPVFLPISGVQRSPRQSMHSAGGFEVMPSHHTPPSGVSATLVKMVLRLSVAIAFGFVFALVPGATPKKPASGFIARRWPFASGRIHAMASPTHHTFHPSKPLGGIIIAKLVLPHALGNAAATYVF